MQIFSFFNFSLIISTVLLTFSTASCLAFQTKTSKYLIPKDYVGWVRIYREIKNAPSVPVSDDGLNYTFKVQPDGKLITSAPDFESHIKFYFDEDAKETEILYLGDMIQGYESGSYVVPCVFVEGQTQTDKNCSDGGIKISYDLFYVGTNAQYQEANNKIKNFFDFFKTTLSNDLKEYNKDSVVMPKPD